MDLNFKYKVVSKLSNDLNLTLVRKLYQHFPQSYLPLSLVSSVCRALVNRSIGLVQSDLAHLTAASITMVLLDAKDKASVSVWSVNFDMMPCPATMKLAMSTIF